MVRGLVGSLQRVAASNGDVEQVLDDYVGDAADSLVRQELLALRWYIRDVIQSSAENWRVFASTVTNYDSLLHRLDRGRRDYEETVQIVTFNYDRLIDFALHEAGVRMETPGDYTADASYQLFKLHGSTNWRRIVRLPSWDGIEESTIARASEVELTNEFHSVNTMTSEPWLPAIAVPVRTKALYECPKEHVERLDVLLPGVDRCLVIGWRGFEETFLSKCYDLMGECIWHVVGGHASDAKKTAAHLKSRLNGQSEVLASQARGFTGFLEQEGGLGALWERRPPPEADRLTDV
jgi:hypothetical protein